MPHDSMYATLMTAEAKILLIYSRYSDLLINMIVEFHAW